MYRQIVFYMEKAIISAFQQIVDATVAQAMVNLQKKNEVEIPRYYTVNEAAVILRVSRVTIYNLFKKDRIQPLKIGGRTLIAADALDKAVESKQVFKYKH